MLHRFIIEKAIEAAKQSEHASKHGAVIFKGKRIYSIGYNQPSRSVKSLSPKAAKWSTSIHAEVSAILNAKRNIEKLDLLVIRVNNRNQLLLSKPCGHCLAYLNYCGIRDIYYSTDFYPYIERL